MRPLHFIEGPRSTLDAAVIQATCYFSVAVSTATLVAYYQLCCDVLSLHAKLIAGRLIDLLDLKLFNGAKYKRVRIIGYFAGNASSNVANTSKAMFVAAPPKGEGCLIHKDVWDWNANNISTIEHLYCSEVRKSPYSFFVFLRFSLVEFAGVLI